MTVALVLLAAFLIGGVPFGYLLVKASTGKDVRSMGSGNIGATNVLRTSGRGVAVLTLLLDIGKGALAVWLAEYFTGSIHWMTAAAVAVMLGHAYPVFLKFRGGKAVASFIGAFLYLMPVPLLATLVIFVVTVAASRYISLGSVVAAGLFPLAVFLIEHPPLSVLLGAAVSSVFIIYRHRANLDRIRAGTESVFAWGGRGRRR